MDEKSKCNLCVKHRREYLYISIILMNLNIYKFIILDKGNILFVEKMDYHVYDIIAISHYYDIVSLSDRVILSTGLLHHEQKFISFYKIK